MMRSEASTKNFGISFDHVLIEGMINYHQVCTHI